jgi:urease accessory protein
MRMDIIMAMRTIIIFTITGTIIPATTVTNMSGKKKNLPLAKGRVRKGSKVSGRRMVRDAQLRCAPHHEAERSTSEFDPLILRSRAKPGVSKDEGPLHPASLYRLMAWLSPSYPVGAFSYSSGIEWAVETGDIRDAATLRDWLAAMMEKGSGLCDAIFLLHAHRASAVRDGNSLRDLAELAAAFAPSKERHLETTAQGRAFLDATRAAWPCAALDLLAESWDGPVAYPVAVGIAAAGHGIGAGQTLHAFLHAIAANWISAGVRLIPLGQTDGQRVLAALEEVIAATAAHAQGASLDDLGSATFRADLAGMRHETQYTRLFRS